MTKPKVLRRKADRAAARADRNEQWRFMERVAALAPAPLWFCNWNKLGKPEAADEFRVSLVEGVPISSWLDAHEDWFILGKWNERRYAFPVSLTDTGRAALADRNRFDMEPVFGGMVEPGWQATPLPRMATHTRRCGGVDYHRRDVVVQAGGAEAAHRLRWWTCATCGVLLPIGPARDEGVTNVENEIAAVLIFEHQIGRNLDPRGELHPMRAKGWRRDEVDAFEMSGSSYREGDLARAIYDHHFGGDLHVTGAP